MYIKADNTEVVLMSRINGKIDERVIGYINEPPMVVASHLFIGYFITYINDVELFPMADIDLVYSLKLNPYPFQVAETIDISSLDMYEPDLTHPLFKASVSNARYSAQKIIDGYNSRISLVSSGNTFWTVLGSEVKSIANEIL